MLCLHISYWVWYDRSWAVILTDLIYYHFAHPLVALLLLKSNSLFTAYLKLKFSQGSFKKKGNPLEQDDM